MSESERMRELVAGYRGAIDPSASDRRRVWARLAQAELPRLPELDLSARREQHRRASWRGIGMTIAIACAVAATVVLVLGLAERVAQRTVERAPMQSPDVQHVLDERSFDVRTHQAAALPPTRAPAGAPAPETPVAPIRVRTPAEHDRPTTPVADDPLLAELALIEAARAAIDRGDQPTALQRLAEHRARHPDGELAPEARALRAIALCASGQRVQGRGEARVLLGDRESAAHHARVREACGLQ